MLCRRAESADVESDDPAVQEEEGEEEGEEEEGEEEDADDEAWPLRLAPGPLFSWEASLGEAVSNLASLLNEDPKEATKAAAEKEGDHSKLRYSPAAFRSLRRLPMLIRSVSALLGASHWTHISLLEIELDCWTELAARYAPPPLPAPPALPEQTEPQAAAGGGLTGDCVRIEGLVSKPELNGATGVARVFLASTGRYCVQVGEKSFNLKPENLRRIAMDAEAARWLERERRAERRALSAMRCVANRRFADASCMLEAIWKRTELLWRLRTARGEEEVWETLSEVMQVLEAWRATARVLGGSVEVSSTDGSAERLELALSMLANTRRRAELEYGVDSEDARALRETESAVASECRQDLLRRARKHLGDLQHSGV